MRNSLSFHDEIAFGQFSNVARTREMNMRQWIEPLEPRKLLAGTAPQPPAWLSVPDHSAHTVTLISMESAANDAIYNVFSRQVGHSWKTIGKSAAATGTFVDRRLAPNTSYAYRVIAYNHAGASTPVYSSSVTTSAGSPTHLVKVAVFPGSISLHWKAVTSQMQSQTLVEKAPNGEFSVVASLAANVRYYSVEGLLPNANYTFYLYGEASGGQSDGPAVSPLITTASLQGSANTLTAKVTPNSASLSWGVSGRDFAELELKKSVAPIGVSTRQWSDVALLSNRSLSYTVTGLEQNTSYDFLLVGVTPDGMAVPLIEGPVVRTSTVTSLPAPTNVTITPAHNSGATTSVIVTLTDNSQTEQGYKIEYSPIMVNAWTVAGVYPGSASIGPRLFTISGLAGATPYQIRVSAVNGNVSSHPVVGSVTTAAGSGPSLSSTVFQGKTITVTGVDQDDHLTSATDPYFRSTHRVISLTRYNPDGSVDSTYGNSGITVVRDYHLTQGGPLGYTDDAENFYILSTGPNGQIVGYLARSPGHSGYGGGLVGATEIFISGDGKQILPGKWNYDWMNFDFFHHSNALQEFWTSDGKLVEYFPHDASATFLSDWNFDILNADFTPASGAPAIPLHLPESYGRDADGIALLPGGLVAFTDGVRAVVTNIQGVPQPNGLTAPLSATLNGSTLTFTTHATTETGYVIQAGDRTLWLPPTVGDGTFTYTDSRLISLVAGYRPLFFAVNGALESGSVIVSGI